MTIKLGLQQELHGCKKGQLQLPASSHYCSDATTEPFLVAAQMLHLLYIQNDSSQPRQPILVLTALNSLQMVLIIKYKSLCPSLYASIHVGT